MGAQLLAAVERWPPRDGVLVSELLHEQAPLRVALLRVVRAGEASLPDLALDLGVPVEDAEVIAAAVVERGACDRGEGGGLRRRPAFVRPHPDSALLDLLDGDR